MKDLSVAWLGEGDAFSERFYNFLGNHVGVVRPVANNPEDAIEKMEQYSAIVTHGAFIASFDKEGNGLRKVVAEIREKYPDIYTIGVVYNPEVKSGAHIKVSYDMLIPSLFVSLNEIIKFVDSNSNSKK